MRLGLTTTQLERFRANVAQLLPQTAVIQSVANGSDGAGGWSETWTAVTGGTVNCRLDPLKRSADEVDVIGEKETMRVMYQCTVPYDAPIVEGNRLVVDGKTYQVVALAIDHAWKVSKRVLIGELR